MKSKIIIPGHRYEVPNFENPNRSQTIQFIEKEPVIDTTSSSHGELRLVNDGTTNEDLLEVIIDRMYYLQSKFPCRENALAITKMEEALFWLNKRTADRQKRNVEGKHIA